MNEGYEETMEIDITAAELPPEMDIEDITETGTENNTTEDRNGESEGDNGGLEEDSAETAAPLPELVPEDTVVSPELPSVSANDLPSLPPALPVEPPQETDNTEDLPADSTVSIAELLENAQNFDELLAVVRELSETVSAQTYAAEPSGLPMNGYEDYDYPVSVMYRIFPPALGSETGLSGTYTDPEGFNAAYKDLQADVQAGHLSYCYVRYVYDANDECVYDSEEADSPLYVPEALPEQPEASDETMNAVLESLGNIETGIQSIADADTAYHTEVALLQEQYAALLQDAYALQQQNGILLKGLLVSNVAVGFVLILTLGYTVAHGFFQRMKVG